MILFAWVLGVDRGFDELNRGAEIRIPRVRQVHHQVRVARLSADVIFGFWILPAVLHHAGEPRGTDAVAADRQNGTVQFSVGFIVVVAILFALLIAQSVKRWNAAERGRKGG